jgi:hypothetical protein
VVCSKLITLSGNGCPRRTAAEIQELDGTHDQSCIVFVRLDMESEKPRNNNHHDHYSDDVEDIHLCTPSLGMYFQCENTSPQLETLLYENRFHFLLNIPLVASIQ